MCHWKLFCDRETQHTYLYKEMVSLIQIYLGNKYFNKFSYCIFLMGVEKCDHFLNGY